MLYVREIEDSDRLVNAEHHFGATGLNFWNRKNVLPCIVVINNILCNNYISDLRKRLVKSVVEGKEEKSYFVKFCRKARVKLTRTT